jgi:branched-chain amino acid aminotransferase
VTQPLAYLNGRLVPEADACLPVSDAGLVMAATVTEMVRTFRRRPYRLTDHLDRLLRSLQYARLSIGLSIEELAGIALDLIDHNGRLLEEDDDLGVILLVTAGPVRTYARMRGPWQRSAPTVCVHTFPIPFDLYERKMQHGVHLITSAIRQVPASSVPPQMKCRSRMHYYLAEQEVRLADPDAAALLLDLDGHVTETNAANFLMVVDGTIISPPSAITLPGISRQTVIDLAKSLGITFVEENFPIARALMAAEAFLTSTPCCLMPVTQINGVVIGSGRPGPVFGRLLQAWSRQVGLDIRKQCLDRAARQRLENERT